MTDKKRTWLKAFIGVFLLTAGLPYLMMLIGLILMPFGLSYVLFMPALCIHNVYFMLPELIFGNTLYPSEEFGYLPSFAGYTLATLLYGIIAFAVSFPVAAGLGKLKQRKANKKMQDISA